MALKIVQHADASAFLEVAGTALYAQETVNNLILGICEQLVRDPEYYKNPFFSTAVTHSAALALAAVMMPPHSLVLAGSDHFTLDLAPLTEYLLANHIKILGVIGPMEIGDSFVSTWCLETGLSIEISMNNRVYELREVRTPHVPRGHFRIAIQEDGEQISRWLDGSEREALREAPEGLGKREKGLIDSGNVFVWDQEGKPVSMALKKRPIAHSNTIRGVYTPPEYRCKGFATALVARLSQHLLDLSYQFVNLFTDLDNPTSNSIYKKIGYHSVCDFRTDRFKSLSRKEASFS